MPTGQAAEQAAQRKSGGSQPADTDKGPGSISGNITRDPEMRYTPNGRAVTSIRIASSERVRNDTTGAWEDGQTTYYDVTCWGQLAENVCEVLEKGDRGVAEGRWTETPWTGDKEEERQRVSLTARDLGPSMMFRCARPVRPTRAKS